VGPRRGKISDYACRSKARRHYHATVYERYRDRDDILRAVRVQTRRELYGQLSRTRTLSQACERYLEFALARSHSYEVLFDRIAQRLPA